MKYKVVLKKSKEGYSVSCPGLPGCWAINQPVKEVIRADGRIRRWAQIPEMEGKYLRVILLTDAGTVHEAFFRSRTARG